MDQGIAVTHDPRVSIAIRASRPRWLREAISSVLNQSFRSLELVIYDDAGNLNHIVKEFVDPRVHYHRADIKRGPGGRFKAAVSLGKHGKQGKQGRGRDGHC